MNEVGREWAGWMVWGCLGEVSEGVEGEHSLGLCWEDKNQSGLYLHFSE